MSIINNNLIRLKIIEQLSEIRQYKYLLYNKITL